MSQPDIPAAPSVETPAASAAGIHKRFGSTHALRGVGLSLYPGRCLGLVGRNGAGKSTLVSILSGLVPQDAGEVSPCLGILILVAVGVVVGLVNGLLIVKARLNGFIVTLGMTILLAGIQDGIVK